MPHLERESARLDGSAAGAIARGPQGF